MALWNKTNARPKGLSKQDNRTTVVTDRGFERIVGSGTRVKKEILIPLGDLTTTFPKPGVTDVWHEPTSGTIAVTVLTGTVAATNSTTLTGTGTSFSTQLAVGNKIRVGASTYRTVSAIANNTSLTMSATISGTTSGQAIAKFTADPVVTKISFAEPLTIAGAAKITVTNSTDGATVTAVAPTTASGGNILAFAWTPQYPGDYTIAAQSIANNTATAINLRSANADTETANTAISSGMAAAPGTYVLSNG